MSTSLRLAVDPLPRPPRLQPSPSLPNLRARNSSSDLLPARPPPTTHKSSSHPHSFGPANSSSIKEGDILPAKRSRQQSKSHHYLTPPLTPASSLKSDSTDPDLTDLSPPTDRRSPPQNIPHSDAAESRFLIVGNVPDDLSEDVVGPYFYSLAALPDHPPSTQTNTAASNVVQKVYFSFQEKRAIIIAFYDVRDAQRVKRLIEANSSHPRRGPDANDEHPASCPSTAATPWAKTLTCLFVAPDHFLQLLGQSAAMTHTEGAFRVLAVRTTAECDHNYSDWSRPSSASVLKTIEGTLTKFGGLKSLQFLKEDEEKRYQLFAVEYYDVRAGDLAWEGLNGRVIDNVRLRLISRNALRGGYVEPRDLEEDLVSLEGHLGSGHAAEPKTPTTSAYLSHSQPITIPSGVPFPLLNDAGTSDYPSPCEHEAADAINSATGVNGHKSSTSDRQKPTSRHPLDNFEPTADVDHHVGTFAADQFGRRSSNNLFFDAVRSRQYHKVGDADSMRTANTNPIAFDCSQMCPFDVPQVAGGAADLCAPLCPGVQPQFVHDYFSHADRYGGDGPVQPSWVTSPVAHSMQYPVSPQSPMPALCPSICWDASTGTWVAWGAPGVLPEQWSGFPPPQGYYHSASSQAVPYTYPSHASPSLVHHPYGMAPNRACPTTYPGSPRVPPENNQLDVRKIEQGLDTRTTVMIKNIPNKMTDKELIAYINKICPRRIDFLYLRMDFQNGCNVGYAFVNFIGVEDLLRFARATLGEKWNMYSSEKVLQMSYANYQGKEALVEKFKNSCIMDEREEWRPKIFFSDPGPKQGLPEEFPKPTHMRRKERSSYNRGALFVPGINAGTGYPKTFLNATATHQRVGRSSTASQGDERQRKLNYPTHDSNVQ